MPITNKAVTARIEPALNGRMPAAILGATLSDEFGSMGTRMAYARNEEIFGEGEPAEYLYQVVSGSVRCSRILADGRRQISAFYLPGDFFGLEIGDEHSSSCEALGATSVVVFKRSAVIERAKRDLNAARKLWEITTADLARAQLHALQLIRSAEERVGSFLLAMASRSSTGNQLELPMSRQDIADHLGLTIETVSRTMTHFTEAGLIALPCSRRVVLLKRSTLEQLNG
jgi:CRP-like cAMP-binding protein